MFDFHFERTSAERTIDKFMRCRLMLVSAAYVIVSHIWVRSVWVSVWRIKECSPPDVDAEKSKHTRTHIWSSASLSLLLLLFFLFIFIFHSQFSASSLRTSSDVLLLIVLWFWYMADFISRINFVSQREPQTHKKSVHERRYIFFLWWKEKQSERKENRFTRLVGTGKIDDDFAPAFSSLVYVFLLFLFASEYIFSGMRRAMPCKAPKWCCEFTRARLLQTQRKNMYLLARGFVFLSFHSIYEEHELLFLVNTVAFGILVNLRSFWCAIGTLSGIRSHCEIPGSIGYV